MADTKAEKAAKDALTPNRPPATPPEKAPPGAMRDATGQPVGATVPTSYALDKTSEQRTRDREENKESVRKSAKRTAKGGKGKGKSEAAHQRKEEREAQKVHREGDLVNVDSSARGDKGEVLLPEYTRAELKEAEKPGHLAVARAERVFNNEVNIQWACPQGENVVNSCGRAHSINAHAGWSGKQSCQCGRRYILTARGDGSGAQVELMGAVPTPA